jgi:hypothetical protein
MLAAAHPLPRPIVGFRPPSNPIQRTRSATGGYPSLNGVVSRCHLAQMRRGMPTPTIDGAFYGDDILPTDNPNRFAPIIGQLTPAQEFGDCLYPARAMFRER